MADSKLKYRFIWTWDHSMDWSGTAGGIQEHGCANRYCKDPEHFVQDYKHLIDFSAAHGFTGVTIYGLLRDCHGGVDAAQDICRYGRDKGVLIIPGVGVNCYGGVYWEGKHTFNLSDWLDRHPKLEAVGQPFPGHPYLRIGCPSKKENQQWMRDAVRWLSETFDIGGINFETGDYGLCQCDQCQQASGRTAQWSAQDMSQLLPDLIEEAQGARSNVLPICECYFDNVLDTDSHWALEALPRGTILQFTINDSYLPRLQKEMTAEVVAQLPKHEKVIRTHIGSQWNKQRHSFVARDFCQLVKTVAQTAMVGVTIIGEVSATRTVHEINYLSLAHFADMPGSTWDDFLKRNLASLLDGKSRAVQYIDLLEKEDATHADIEAAMSALRDVGASARRRWLWLTQLLYERVDKNGWDTTNLTSSC